jgi:D-alanyl-lipoteichoic acid acyltransferase DltB (MBOAT superfamily)
MYLHALSFVFLFCPLVVAGGWLLSWSGHVTSRKTFLLVASIVFYVSAGWPGLPVLAGSVLLNYLFVRRVGSTANGPARRRWLIAGLVANVAVLGVFKYTAFVVGNLAALTGYRYQLPRLVLPLGISFFTISQVMYLVDCYEGMASPAPLLDHALFTSFFPYVTAGPIVRARDIIPQFEAAASLDGLAAGVVLFLLGLTKKVVVADTFGQLVDVSFSAPHPLGFVDGWVAALSFTLQIYCDFSGYSDMALAVGMMLGLRLPLNFNAPLRAVSVTDFWKRWHISLSSFITTYLYSPMARAWRPFNLKKAIVVTLVSMTIAGLWHGAAWTYVIFGLLHGLGLVINQLWKKTKIKVPRPAAWAMTFVFVVGAFVMFRAGTVGQARALYASMLGAHGLRGPDPLGGLSRLEWVFVLPIMLLGAGAALVGRTSNQIVADLKPSGRLVLGCAGAFLLCLHFMNASVTKGFIYRGF